MPSTKCIRQRLCFIKSCDKEMFLFIYAASGPLNLSLHLHRALCHNAGLICGLSAKCFCNKISALCKNTTAVVSTVNRTLRT